MYAYSAEELAKLVRLEEAGGQKLTESLKALPGVSEAIEDEELEEINRELWVKGLPCSGGNA